MGKIKSEDADARFGQCLEFFPLYSMPVRWLRQFLFSCSIHLRLLVDEFGNWLHFSRRNNQFFLASFVKLAARIHEDAPGNPHSQKFSAAQISPCRLPWRTGLWTAGANR